MDASLAFLRDAIRNSQPGSLKTLGLVPNNSSDNVDTPEFDLASMAQDPTPAELLSKSAPSSSMAISRLLEQNNANGTDDTSFFDKPFVVNNGRVSQELEAHDWTEAHPSANNLPSSNPYNGKPLIN